MQFGSVCSGIEAASVAFSPLGWRAAWLAEIEPFPCAVLAHHYPQVPNLGDMTTIARRVLTGSAPAPDVLCGGTPCQAFSVAGLRQSLADERGNLSLKFVELADAIDHVRTGRGEDECIVFWENVPGVLSTKDNAFGCFLAGLAGEDEPLQPPGKKWTNAGVVYGPRRAIAWRTLDAQYFGVAQRRRRVFVVASARDGFNPAQVLFEWDGVRRDSPPSREAGKGFAADIAPSLTASGRGVERIGETRGQDPVVAQCLTTGTGQRYDPETETILPVAFNSRQDPVSGDVSGALDTCSPQAQAVVVSLRGRDGGATAELGGEVGNCLLASSGGGDKPYVLAPAIALQTDVTPKASTELAFTLKLPSASGGGQPAACMTPQMAVRRLTPRECERLQGFPDNYTLIPYRGKPAADGPRYKALGNSWAVPVAAWIGRRIDAAVRKLEP